MTPIKEVIKKGKEERRNVEAVRSSVAADFFRGFVRSGVNEWPNGMECLTK